jgi:hypothetical protein
MFCRGIGVYLFPNGTNVPGGCEGNRLPEERISWENMKRISSKEASRYSRDV